MSFFVHFTPIFIHFGQFEAISFDIEVKLSIIVLNVPQSVVLEPQKHCERSAENHLDILSF